MSNKNRGFSLIELMVTIMIVGILTSIAGPAYRNYITRAKIAKAFPLAYSMKDEISQYFQDNLSLPCCGSAGSAILGQAGYLGPPTLTNPTNEITAIGYYGVNNTLAHIDVQFSTAFTAAYLNSTGVATVTLQVQVVDNQLVWFCGPNSADALTVPLNFLPLSCQTPLSNSAQTYN